MNLRIVFDTSTLVSAALRVDSVPYKAYRKALNAFDLCSSQETLRELEKILTAPKFDRYVSAGSRHEFIEQFRKHAQHYTVPVDLYVTVSPRCRDPKDDPFLALAAVASAATIVSSDADLLSLHPWNDIAILQPAQFLQTAEPA